MRKLLIRMMGRDDEAAPVPSPPPHDVPPVDRDERVEQIGAWIPKNVVLLDIGCGGMELQRLASPKEYIPVDRMARDSRTVVVDWTTESLPREILERAEWATLIGALERIPDATRLLTDLADHGIQVVCSHALKPEGAGHVSQRNPLQLSQHWHQCGFDVAQSKRIGTHGVYWLKPVIEASSTEDAPVVSLKFPGSTTSRPDRRRPKLVLSGHFGRGNAGDEALLQVQYELFSKHFEVIISVEQHGACRGFWDWYPYDQCELIGHENLGIFFRQDIVGMHVGGGDLDIGFNAGQVIAARAAGKTVQMSGVDFGQTYDLPEQILEGPDTHRTYLEWTQPWIRSRGGYEKAMRLSRSVRHGADWALRLAPDRKCEATPGKCLLVLREFPEGWITSALRRDLLQLITSIQSRFGDPILVPFCPEDERILDRFESTWGLERLSLWNQPARIKHWIAESSLVVSVGRFHPLVFATSTRTPVVFCEWSRDAFGDVQRPSDLQTLKAFRFCQETGIEYFSEIPSLVEALDNLQRDFRSVAIGTDHFLRFDAMVHSVVARYQQAAQQLGLASKAA